ncbi:class D beta-lactamase [Sphaerothrix gracilis]|uniref:class D beta-lactamase n=1 Tax=Sphaerothrix gracilis TaxID=3151835 RepID=UPI0031FD34FA
MNRAIRFTSITLVSLSCIVFTLFQTTQPVLSFSQSTIEASSAANIAQNLDFGRHFQDLGVEGSIMIYDSKNDRTFQHNPERNTTGFLPASTYKILNSLIALETGVISDEIAVLTWDGIQRTVPQWNRDLNMKEAIRLSAVWFYQVLARRIGHERMRDWVAQVGYGNQQIGSSEDIDQFWLQGELRITPQEQIQFLRRFYEGDLPFSERSISIVKDIMLLEQTPEYTIRGKSGWVGFGDDASPQIGWLVGYLEKEGNVYYFATNIEIRSGEDAAARMEITRRCFSDLALL